MEDDIYEIPGQYFSKATARVFDKKDNGNTGALPSSKFVYLVETLGEYFNDSN